MTGKIASEDFIISPDTQTFFIAEIGINPRYTSVSQDQIDFKLAKL